MNINRVRERDRQQRFFPDIHFTCNGYVTKWIVGARTGDSNDQLQPELQIWRRNNGKRNSYIKINFSLLTPNATSDTNVHEYYPDPPLEFQEGDILGVYTPRKFDSRLRLYYQVDTGPENYEQTRIDPPAPTAFTLRSTNSQNDYPLVTVEISTGMMTLSCIVQTPLQQYNYRIYSSQVYNWLL